jgi:hypothetical protein
MEKRIVCREGIALRRNILSEEVSLLIFVRVDTSKYEAVGIGFSLSLRVGKTCGNQKSTPYGYGTP